MTTKVLAGYLVLLLCKEAAMAISPRVTRVEADDSCARELIGAKANDTVTVHYTAALKSNGKQFDSSVGGQPISFQLGAGKVIEGWEQGLLGTCQGERIRLEIPSSLGYGSKGAGDVVPPNADLVFQVTLLRIQRPVRSVTLVAKRCEFSEKSRNKDVVDFLYVGRLPNGTIFSQTDAPIKIEVGKTGIEGWDMALSGMCAGELKRVVLPPELAYGEKGIPDSVPPNSVVILDVELVSIEDRVLSFLHRTSEGRFGGKK